MDRPLRLITANPVDQLARTVEALLVVASAPLSVDELAQAADDDPERIETALGLLCDRYREGRSGIVLEKVAGGYAFRAAREARRGLRAALRAAGRARALAGGARDARDRRLPRPVQPARDRPHPRRRGRLGRRRARRARADRRGGARRRPGGAVRYRTTPLFERVFGLESLAALPRLDDLGDTAAEIRERLHRGGRQDGLAICQEPPRRTGTRSPSRVMPSTSTSLLPIMKSTWMSLTLTRSRSASSSTGNV